VGKAVAGRWWADSVEVRGNGGRAGRGIGGRGRRGAGRGIRSSPVAPANDILASNLNPLFLSCS
jgi:hypothetical protein